MTGDRDPGWAIEERAQNIALSGGAPTALVAALARYALDYIGEQLPMWPNGRREWTFVSRRKVHPEALDTLLAQAYRSVNIKQDEGGPLFLRTWRVASGGRLCIVVAGPVEDSAGSIART